MDYRHLSSTTLLSLPETQALVQAGSAREPARWPACTQREHVHASGSERPCLSRSWSLVQLRSLGFRDWGPLPEEQVSRSDPMDLHSSRSAVGPDCMEVSTHENY